MPRENQHITDVIIRGYKYQLWDLVDREPHSLGTDNGESGTLWVKKNGGGPFAEQKDDPWIPWLDISGNRNCWEIHIKDGNSIKYKHVNYDISKHTSVYISLNNDPVYEVMGRDFDWCYNKSRSIIYHLEELMNTFDVNLKNSTKEKGRKIYYKGLPAIIEQVYVTGTINIKPDYSDMDKDTWWNEILEPWYDDYTHENWEVMKEDNGIVVDILSNDIHWTRNDRSVKLNKIKRTVNEKRTS